MTQNQLNYYSEKTVKLMLLTMLFIVPLIFYTKTNDVFELNKLTAFRLLTLIAFLAFLINKAISQSWSWRPSPLWAPVLFVGLTSLGSTIISNNRLTSIFGVYEDFEGILMIANYIMLWVLIHQTTRTLEDVKKYLYIIVIAGTITTAYGIAQNFGIDFIRWNPNTYTATRMFGALGNPNFLAAYALMSLPIAWMFFIINRRLSSKLLFLMVALTMVVAIFFTKSRGAFYGLVVEIMVFTIYLIYDHLRTGRILHENKRWLILFVFLAALTLLSPQVRQTVATTIARTAATLNISEVKMTPRLYIWKSALKMMVDKPIFGSGLDTFQITFPKYRLPLYWQLEWNGTPEKAHNFFLQIGATTGFLGLGTWLWLLVTYFAIIFMQIKRLSAHRRHLLVAIAIAQIGFLVQNQFNFTVIAYGSLFWFFIGLAPTMSRQEDDAPAGQDHPRPEQISTMPGRLRQLLQLNQLSIKQIAALLGISVILAGAMFWSLRLWTADMFFKRGIIYLTRGYPDKALPELHRAVTINPWREIYWVKEGIANEEMAKRASKKVEYLQKAEAIHKHTIEMNEMNGYDYNNLGRVYKFWGERIDKRKLQAAKKACLAAVERDPYNAYFNLDLATILISLRQWDEVEKAANHLIELFPNFAMPYAYIGYVALMKNDINRAHEKLSLAAGKNWRGDVHTRASTLSNLGIVKVRLGRLDGALKVLDEALRLKPQYIEARHNKGMVLEKLGLFAQAAHEYKTIIGQAPHYQKVPELKQKITRLERGTP